MDYLKNYTKKDRKKYYLLVVALDRFTAIRHLIFISCLLPLLKWYAGTYCRMTETNNQGVIFLSIFCRVVF